jgi:hypothetical protein
MRIITHYFVCLLFLGALILSSADAQPDHGVEKDRVYKTTEIFIEALIDGDVSTLRSYITGSLKNRVKTLLYDNKNYSQFLKTRYADALFLIGDPKIHGKKAFVNISIEFPENEIHYFKIELKKIKKGDWIITEQSEVH